MLKINRVHQTANHTRTGCVITSHSGLAAAETCHSYINGWVINCQKFLTLNHIDSAPDFPSETVSALFLFHIYSLLFGGCFDDSYHTGRPRHTNKYGSSISVNSNYTWDISCSTVHSHFSFLLSHFTVLSLLFL